MNKFDHLIPSHIIEKMGLDQVDLVLTLRSACARNTWPHVRVSVNDQMIFDDRVIEKQVVTYNKKHAQETVVSINVEYLDKTDEYTVVDDRGNIIENQHVMLESLLANDVDLVNTNLIYNFGRYYLNLDDAKKEFFKLHGYETETSHSLQMFENGAWILNIRVPILPELIKHKAFYEKHERWPDDNFMTSMYNKLMFVEQATKTNGN